MSPVWRYLWLPLEPNLHQIWHLAKDWRWPFLQCLCPFAAIKTKKICWVSRQGGLVQETSAILSKEGHRVETDHFSNWTPWKRLTIMYGHVWTFFSGDMSCFGVLDYDVSCCINFLGGFEDIPVGTQPHTYQLISYVVMCGHMRCCNPKLHGHSDHHCNTFFSAKSPKRDCNGRPACRYTGLRDTESNAVKTRLLHSQPNAHASAGKL